MKVKLIQQFLQLYTYYWKTNCGIDIFRLQNLSEQQLMERITDYTKLNNYRL